MSIQFRKMHSLGNDFMVMDATKHPFALTRHQIQALADRHRGVGFDQLLVLASPSSDDVDFDYLIFNRDGSSAEQCGNGARCMAQFIHIEKKDTRKEWRLLTAGRITLVRLEADDSVTVEISDPDFTAESVGLDAPGPSAPYSLAIAGQLLQCHVVSVGNPHAVVCVDEIDAQMLDALGAELSVHPRFSQGVNVGFMNVHTPDHIQLWVYERGVGHTLACGSGACAAMAVGRQLGLLQDQVQVTQPGGELWITWHGAGSSIHMRGPAHDIYRGCLTGQLLDVLH